MKLVSRARSRDVRGTNVAIREPVSTGKVVAVNVPWWVRHQINGRILILDDIEDSLKWLTAAGTITQHTADEVVFEGTYCLKMLTSGAAGDNCTARRYSHFPGLSKMYLALYWSPGTTNDKLLRDFKAELTIFDGAHRHRAAIRFRNYLNGVAKKLYQLYGSDGQFTNIPDAGQDIHTNQGSLYNYLRFGIDLTKGKYRRLQANELDLNLSSYAYQMRASTTKAKLYIELENITDIASASTLYVDAILLTDQES